MSRFELEIITDNERWNKLVERSEHRDIHSLPNYMSLLAKHMGGKAILIYWGNDDNYLIWPYIKKELVIKNMKYFDLISSWYYGGPLIYGNLNKEILENYFHVFTKYCQDNNIVTEFSRFHPDLDNHIKFESIIQLNKIGIVVWLDLNQELEQIMYDSFEKRARTAVRRSEKLDVKIIIDSSDEYLKSFHELYIRSMDAKKARSFYYFTYEFLADMRRILEDNFVLISGMYEGNLVGGSVFIFKYDKIYYYFSARDPDLDKAYANNRILYEAIKYGKEKKLNIFDLGGGAEGSSLLKFKRSFSNTTKDLYGYNRIHHKPLYETLCHEKGLNKTELNYENASFFPEYRLG